MAKKKSSAKQTKQVKKTSPKKAVKKAAPKKKPVTKKAASKAVSKAPSKVAAKKKTAPVKKTAKKVAPKAAKVVAKKSAATKSAPKKAAPKAKSASKTAKPSSASSVKPVNQHLVRTAAPAKPVIDLSHFVTPLDDRLIVQLSGAEKMTAGGLYIPDTVSDVSGNLHGTVVAAGRGHISKKGHLRPMDVKVGDKIVFAEYAGSKIKIQNEDLVIIREGDVMGVVSK